MGSSGSPQSGNFRRPHPLAAALVERLGDARACVLDIGSGSGRNTFALRDAGFLVHSVADADVAALEAEPGRFDAAISTHAFLHGTPASIARLVLQAARALKAGAPLHCTFASKRDARFGVGTRVAEDAYAPEGGDEAGVPHAYFDEQRLRRLIEEYFVVESLGEYNVDDVVGSWAHSQRPSGSVHWFLIAHKRDSDDG